LIEHGCVRSAGRGIGAIKQRETRRKESNMNRKELIFRMATILLAANANKDNAPDRKFIAEEARLLLNASAEKFSTDLTDSIAVSVATIYANIIRSNPKSSDPAQRNNAIAWAGELLAAAAEAAIKK